ncbi:nitrate- and nitrite sensing domain-containing protein [Streptomyces sp. GC420]|uniref:nitrate- and nitrite sensing domain-containing protein n=1 Tax=Streptomyces sp. GC420 TaxID=2697568 RepID=UPI001414F390|nr:nitrate- and nitrite sensing domain-containing protein [Streptomyces sp. GC420]NBM18957.1 HAMP domain-containing protein [Streptomyces sp. GC420]
MGPPQARQGRGEAAAEQEPRGGNDRGSSPQHAQGTGPAFAGAGQDRAVQGPGPGAESGGTGQAESGPGPLARSGPGSRIALRNWRISTRLVSLLTLPVVAATVLGATRINSSMDEIEQLDNMQLLTEMTRQASELASRLQEERDKTAGPLANGVSAKDFKVKSPRDKTDRAIESFREGTQDLDNSDGDATLESVRANVLDILTQLNDIKSIRSTAYAGATNAQTVDSYSQLINSLLDLSQEMAQATSSPEMIQRTRALAAFSTAKEYASIQRAVIAAALPDNKSETGKLKEPDRLFGESAMKGEDAARKAFSRVYSGNAEELTAPLDSNNVTVQAADQYAERVLSDPNGMRNREARSYLDWYDADTTKINQMANIEATLLNEMEQKARALRNEAERDAIINGALILLVLGVSLIGAFVVARSMIRSLRRLQETATRVAQDRLPELVKQLSEADPQDVDTSVESVGVHSRDEIGQVAAAFDDVHREAVRLAAEQALLRGNVNAMFTNLSRRSQGLIQRQLSLISELESREADPDQLSSLFKLDHLATRMRRNGENLLVLAGEEPGRRWTRPVPLVDVLRAAASEVEQYERIELAQVPATEVAGRVVNDLVHLLAELLENATSFSSPQTKVKVTGHALPDGRVLIEIHDTGIGLSPEDLAAINERLASPPTVDVSVSRRMGLFVVGRLSQRHGIRIQLRPSDSGGTTALVMLPVDVAQGGKKPPAKQGPAGQPQGAQNGAGRLPGGAGRPGAGGPPPSGGLLGGGGGQRAALPPREGGGGLGSAFSGARGGRAGAQNGGRQLPPMGGPKGELPGAGSPRQPGTSWGSEEPRQPQQRPPVDRPRGHEEAESGGQFARMSDDRQGPGSTSEFPRPGFDMPAPQGNHGVQDPSPFGGDASSTGQFPRPDYSGGQQGPSDTGQFARPGYGAQQGPSDTGQFARPGYGAQQGPSDTGQFARPGYGAQQGGGGQDPSSTGQFAQPDFGQPQGAPAETTGQNQRPGYGGPQEPAPAFGQDPSSTGQFARPELGPGQGGSSSTGQFARPDAGGPARPGQGARPANGRRNSLPRAPQPEALPPAGPGDGRTPLFDTLESDWFRGVQGGDQPAPQQPSVPPQPTHPPQRQPQADRNGGASAPRPGAQRATTGSGQGNPSWRTTPNDELGRQAERVRQPAAGGVTTSGLPRRVPRANLVAGTAEPGPQQSGPQVSRAPADVRGRLTNLRRGIQQGRQAGGNSSTGSFDLGPSHQQEREF